MHMREDNAAKREPPKLAAKYWAEFQGKQMLVSSFFTKRGTETKVLPAATVPATSQSALTTAFDLLDAPDSLFPSSPASQAPQPSPSTQPATEPSPTPPPSLTPPLSSQASTKPSHTSQPSRRRLRADGPTAAEASKSKKLRTGQSKLSSFFSKPSSSTTTSRAPEIVDLCEDGEEVLPEAPLPTFRSDIRPPTTAADDGQGSKENGSKRKRAASWSALFTPVSPPLCAVHGEPAKEYRVNKPGPNKGRTFYLCARPVGPGYDKGRSERRREEVNHQYKCDFFKWTSDVKREAKGSSGGAAGRP